jgi:hypothetical protein
MRARASIEGAVALCLAVAVVVAAAGLGGGKSREADLRASTYLAERRGTRALFLLLDGLGLGPERFLAAPDAAFRKDRTFVVAAPSRRVTREEARALLDWTAAGGRLVVVDAPSAESLTVDCTPLLAPAGLATEAVTGRFAVPRVEDAGLADGVGEIDWPARIVVRDGDPEQRDPRASDWETAIGSPAGAVAARVPFGEGEVVAVADARLLDNEFLRRADNAVLAVNLLVGDGTRRVVFDEFHHGFGDGCAAGVTARLLAMLWTTWPGRALLVLLLAAVVRAFGEGVRFGAPDEEPRPRRRALAEHADALGRLFEGARAWRTALEILLAGARRTAGPRAGLPAHVPAAEFRAHLERSTARGARELAAALAEAERASADPRTKDVQFAEVAARVALARRRYLDG